MADVELVIKIPEEEFGIDIDDKFQDFFKRLKAEIKANLARHTALVCGAYELETIDMFLKAFNNGIPLPRGHGDLIDRDSLELDSDWSDYYDGFSAYSESQVRLAPTIIEADKENNYE